MSVEPGKESKPIQNPSFRQQAPGAQHGSASVGQPLNARAAQFVPGALLSGAGRTRRGPRQTEPGPCTLPAGGSEGAAAGAGNVSPRQSQVRQRWCTDIFRGNTKLEWRIAEPIVTGVQGGRGGPAHSQRGGRRGSGGRGGGGRSGPGGGGRGSHHGPTAHGGGGRGPPRPPTAPIAVGDQEAAEQAQGGAEGGAGGGGSGGGGVGGAYGRSPPGRTFVSANFLLNFQSSRVGAKAGTRGAGLACLRLDCLEPGPMLTQPWRESKPGQCLKENQT